MVRERINTYLDVTARDKQRFNPMLLFPVSAMNWEVPRGIKWLVMATFIPFRDHTDNRHIRVKSRALSKNYNRTAIIQEHTRYNTSAMLRKKPCFDVSNA